ncbi:MAG: SDR family NAD(P)-dependent oxidoreductase [Alphaproteobacteria bacterium]
MDTLFRLDGKVVVVTGASRGLGAAFARTLGRAGARIALMARDASRLDRVAEEIAAAGGKAQGFALDVTDRARVRAAFGMVEASMGTPAVLVNNAGIAVTRRILDVDENDWRSVIDTNLTGAWFVAQEAAQRMAAAGRGGNIVNIASLLALRTGIGTVAYNAAKAGLAHLTRTMAVELARNDIRVNALAPGYFETDMNRDYFATDAGKALIARVPQRRLGQDADLDGPLLFLCADASRYVTGQILHVDGGHSVSPI